MKRCLLLLCLFAGFTHAETVVCHVDYGGATRRISAEPTATPLTVPSQAIGSYFRFRLVFEAKTAIKVYVYADRDDAAPLPLHQAIYPWPPVAAGNYGFTGLHYVYEPVRDGELAYWCATE